MLVSNLFKHELNDSLLFDSFDYPVASGNDLVIPLRRMESSDAAALQQARMLLQAHQH